MVSEKIRNHPLVRYHLAALLVCLASISVCSRGTPGSEPAASPVIKSQTPPAHATTHLMAGIKAPARVVAGETVTIEIVLSSNAPDFLTFRCDSERRAPYRFYSPSAPPPEVPAGKEVWVPANIPARSVTIPLPSKRSVPLYAWVQMWGPGCEVHYLPGDDRPARTAWKDAGSRPGEWRWISLPEVDPADSAAKIVCVVPPAISGLTRGAVLTPDSSFTPNAQTDIPTMFRWQTNRSSVGTHTLRVAAQNAGELETHQLTIEVLDPTTSGPQRKVSARYADLTPAANLPLLANDPSLRMVGDDLKDKATFDLMGFHFPLKTAGPAFVAIAMHDPQAAPVKAAIPQGEDLLKVTPAMLPSTVTIPMQLRGKYLAFLHGVRGNACQLLDELFSYEVAYDDGQTMRIPVRDGERIAAQLKDFVITQGLRVYSTLLDGSTVNLFLTQWENPRPDHALVRLTMTARPRFIGVLLGIAAYDDDAQLLPTVATGHAVHATADFGASLGAPKRDLFSMNAPFLFRPFEEPGNDRYFTLMSELKSPTMRLWNRIHPSAKETPRSFDPAKDVSAETASAYREYARRVRDPVLFNLFVDLPECALTDESTFNAYASWYVDVLCYMRKEFGLTIPYVELYNEQNIGKPIEQRMVRYRFFNAVADRIHAACPEIKVGGMAECWPDIFIIREFIVQCGTHANFISWHMYPTGNVATPFKELMQRTDHYAVFSQQIAAANNEMLPARKLEQAVTEYAINYNAWDPVDSRLAKGYGAVWTLSVLTNCLYHGAVDIASFWHFAYGAYGAFTMDAARPTGTLFGLMNTHLSRADLYRACVDDATQIECLATASSTHYLLALINKTDQVKTVQLEQLNFFPAVEPDVFSRSSEEWTVAGEDDDFTVRRIATPGTRAQTVTLPPFSMRIGFYPKEEVSHESNRK